MLFWLTRISLVLLLASTSNAVEILTLEDALSKALSTHPEVGELAQSKLEVARGVALS